MNDFQKFITNKYIYIPFLVWLCVQTFKVIYELITTKKFNFKRIMGAGGMPSSHSAVVTTLATLVGKYQGVDTPIFAMALVFAMIVMYDAAGVRRAAGKQAHLLNTRTYKCASSRKTSRSSWSYAFTSNYWSNNRNNCRNISIKEEKS